MPTPDLAATLFRPLAGLSLGGGPVAFVLALVIIVNTNIQTVQADTYYKQGLAYEGVGEWEGAMVLYARPPNWNPRKITTTCSWAGRCCSWPT